jgi:hypothetical protein
LQNSVGEEQADSLRLLIVVGGHGAFVPAFGNRAEIILANVNRQSPKSTSLALAQRPHSLGRVAWYLALSRNGARKTVPKA